MLVDISDIDMISSVSDKEQMLLPWSSFHNEHEDMFKCLGGGGPLLRV